MRPPSPFPWFGPVALVLCLVGGEVAPARALELAYRGRPRVDVVLAAGATDAEITAAEELAAYLTRVAAARFVVRGERAGGEPGPTIQVGPTTLVRALGGAPAGFASEEWRVRTHGDHLLLYGGRPRGTLYAVYEFLERYLGVRWWSPHEETIPFRFELSIPEIDARGAPAFLYRDIHYIEGPRAFCARSRLNGHSTRLDRRYGGRHEYGPPRQVHNFYTYVPPEVYFEPDPELYSEIDGERTADRAQLCLTNPALLELVDRKLEAYVREGRSNARAAGEAPPQLYDFSQNDWGLACECEPCRRLVNRERTHAAPLVQFMNALAARVEARNPEILLDTLAYYYSFPPPDHMRLRDNVVVRLAPLHFRDFSLPVAAPDNELLRRAVDGWARTANHLWIWDYTVTFQRESSLPLPNARFFGEDLSYYREHGVEGMFIQHAFPIAADMRDMKIWILAQLLVDPGRDYQRLLEDFTDGFYGPAARPIRDYLELLERHAEAHPSRLGYPVEPADYAWIDLDFARKAERLFDRASRRVADDPVLSRRVDHARMALDWAVLALADELREEAAGHWPPRWLDLGAVRRRYRHTWHDQIALRYPRHTWASRRATLDREIEEYFAP